MDTLDFDHVGLHANSSISLALRQAAARAGRAVRLRIQVTGLDAMCRMIHNGLGVGVMPERAFELMHGTSRLRCVPLRDAWAARQISLVARDFDTLPPTARAAGRAPGRAPWGWPAPPAAST
jgi:DNA-binding transcriptional LysR family regulator